MNKKLKEYRLFREYKIIAIDLADAWRELIEPIKIGEERSKKNE